MNKHTKTTIHILFLITLDILFVWILNKYTLIAFSDSIARTGLPFLETLTIWDNNISDPWISLQPLLAIQNAYFFFIVKLGINLHLGQIILLIALLSSFTTWTFLALKKLTNNHTSSLIATMAALGLYMLNFEQSNTPQMWFIAITPLWLYLISQKKQKKWYLYPLLISSIFASIIALNPILLLIALTTILCWTYLTTEHKLNDWKKIILPTIALLTLNFWWIGNVLYYIFYVLTNGYKLTEKGVTELINTSNIIDNFLVLPIVGLIFLAFYKEKINKKTTVFAALFLASTIIIYGLHYAIIIEILKIQKPQLNIITPNIFGIATLLSLSTNNLIKNRKNSKKISYSVAMVIIIAILVSTQIQLSEINETKEKTVLTRGDYQATDIALQLQGKSIQITASSKQKKEQEIYQKHIQEEQKKGRVSTLEKSILPKSLFTTQNVAVIKTIEETTSKEHLYEDTSIIAQSEGIKSLENNISIIELDNDLKFCIKKDGVYNIKQANNNVLYENQEGLIGLTTISSGSVEKNQIVTKKEKANVNYGDYKNLTMRDDYSQIVYDDLQNNGILMMSKGASLSFHEKEATLEYEETFSNSSQTQWEESLVDCNKYEEKSMEELEMKAEKQKENENDFLQIKTNGHTACVSKNISIDDNGIYTLSFDHRKTHGQDIGSVSLIYRWENSEEQEIIPLNHEKDWNTFTKIIELRGAIKSFDLVFRVSANDEKNILQVDNIKLKKQKKIKTINFEEKNLVQEMQAGCYQVAQNTEEQPVKIDYIDPKFEENGWVQKTTNCHNYENKSFEETQTKASQVQREDNSGKTLVLEGMEGVTCTQKEIQNLRKGDYIVSLDHRTLSGSREAEIKILDPKTGEMLLRKQLPVTKNWYNSEIEFTLEKTLPKAIIMLFIQTNNEVLHKHQFDNLSLRYKNSILPEDFLITKESPENNEITKGESIKNNWNNYSITPAIESPYFIILNQTYHPGWDMTTEENNNHLIINEQKNGWYIEQKNGWYIEQKNEKVHFIQFTPDSTLKKLYLLSILSVLLISTTTIIKRKNN